MESNLDKLQKRIGKDSQASPSPVMRWLNPILIRIDERGLAYQYLIREEMTNPLGKLHGGIAAVMIDDAIGATMIVFDEEYISVTANNTIDYKATAEEGETIIAETQIIENRSRLAIVQCEIWSADKSRMIAKGISKLLKKHR